jgi:hypothetical protein
MRFYASSFIVALALAACGCGDGLPRNSDLQRMIEASPRFQAPETFLVRTRYCATGDVPTDIASGLGRLDALESAGAIHIDRRPAPAGECAAVTAATRQRLDVTLTGTGQNFHPVPIEHGGGWTFTLAHRRFVVLTNVTRTGTEEHPILRVLYQWAWRDELIGQLMQVSEEPVNAQASFAYRDDEWVLRDVGF